MNRKIIWIILILLLSLNTICFANRLALVIGNSNYKGNPLKNPVNDANDIATTLSELDFEVIKRTNLNKRELIEIADSFENSISSNDEVMFYFSGHGMQVGGANYLVPIDSKINKEGDVEYEAVCLDRIINCLEKAKMKIVVLDACRDNPYKGTRSVSKGLAQIATKEDGTFIAYSTAPGTTAQDGTGRNSPYTKNLIVQMKTDLNIERVFKEVRKSVKSETNNKQIPWESSSLTNDFCFSETQKFNNIKSQLKVDDLQRINDLLAQINNGEYVDVPIRLFTELTVRSEQLSMDELQNFVSNAIEILSSESNFFVDGNSESIQIQGGGKVFLYRTNNQTIFKNAQKGVLEVLEAINQEVDIYGINIKIRGKEKFFDIEGLSGVAGRTWVGFDLRDI
ncbi:MAG: caspase family protein [Candidatus Cloacimonetes bacterium]|nr:caspase family protein [Candidatus Cloacimonadota bacterium]